MCSQVPESKAAVLALAKHISLKTPDKAEFRATAANAAIALLRQLSSPEQYNFVVFTASLSRSAKVASNPADPNLLKESPERDQGRHSGDQLCCEHQWLPCSFWMLTRGAAPERQLEHSVSADPKQMI